MQISTNPYMRETSLAYQTPQKQQESTTSFDMLVTSQSHKNSKTQETQVQDLPKTLNDIDFMDNFMAFVGIAQAAMLESERLYGNFDMNKGFEILSSWFSGISETSTQEIVQSAISALEQYQNNGGYLDEFGHLSPKPQSLFEQQKQEAIDILSEILQGIKV